MAVTLVVSYPPWFPFAALIVTAVLVVLPRRRVAASGVLVGFGLLWLLLVGWQFASGGRSDAWPLIFAVAVVPLVVGLGLAVVATRD